MADNSDEAPLNLDEPEGRLIWARIRARFETATDAARHFHWNINTYRSHENGTRSISRKAAARYAKALKVPSGWLLYGEGSMGAAVDPELKTLWEGMTENQRYQVKMFARAVAGKAA